LNPAAPVASDARHGKAMLLATDSRKKASVSRLTDKSFPTQMSAQEHKQQGGSRGSQSTGNP
jgi:hypothetical protein